MPRGAVLARPSRLFEPFPDKKRTKHGAFARAYVKLTCYQNDNEERMTKLRLLGTAIFLSSVLAAPAMAKQIKVGHVMACDPRDPGNPYSQTYDYMTWSAWRRRGGWDTRAEWTCQPIPQHPFGTAF
jgi:hypothetical protein